ncbi:MAG: hypothetical protein JW957_09195 [Candidatus Omnitrophica bacterium]|nr:hypothetical protein [Candidatus Omnitrophota bacterium]
MRKDADGMKSSVSKLFRGDIGSMSVKEGAAIFRPDDLDLTFMARAGLNYLRGNPDPCRGHECKFSLGPLGIPCHYPMIPPNYYGYDPVSLGDTDVRMQWQYRNMREMAGETKSCDVERGVTVRILAYLKDDGLAWLNPAAATGTAVEGEYVQIWTTAKILVTLSELYRFGKERKVKMLARHVFEALYKIVSWDGPRAWYMGCSPWKNGKWLMEGWAKQHGRNYPFIVEPLVSYWESCGDSQAIDLACAFAEGFIAGSQPDMSNQRVNPDTGAYEGHVHIHTHAVWGVAHLGAILKEKRYLDWAHLVYAFTLANGTDYGWYPEQIPQDFYRSETCAVGDMVSLGVWLARGECSDYWDHVERTVRNELRHSQFFLTEPFIRLFTQLHKDKAAIVVEDALRKLKLLEGGFVAQTTFDDWVSYPGNPHLGAAGLRNNGIHMMGCCPPEGMRGIWEAWRWAVEKGPEGIRINMAFSREHPSARITAYSQEDGGYEVIARERANYLLRPPAWADKNSLKLLRNGKEYPINWEDKKKEYVVCRDVQPGEKIIICWKVFRFTQQFKALSVPGKLQTVTVKWIGNEVCGVDPAGKYLTMFGRGD